MERSGESRVKESGGGTCRHFMQQGPATQVPAAAGEAIPQAQGCPPPTYLLDHVVHVLRNLRCQALALQDTQDFGAGDGADLR
eukprot:1140087-Pelagomonas_calceolata.AAC.6